PKAIPYLITGYFEGVARGRYEAGHTIKTGRSPIHIRKVETPSILERKTFFGGNANPLNWMKYVTRMMVAEDVLSFQGLKEARAKQLARRYAQSEGYNTWSKAGWSRVNEILLKTKQRKEIAEQQAIEEKFKKGTVEFNRRVYELMELDRPLEMVEQSYGFAAKGTFNHETEGALGAITNAVSWGLDAVNIGGTKPLRFIVPFTRIITNVVNNQLDYTPIGYIRAIRGQRGISTFELNPVTKSAYKQLSKEERIQLASKATIGITLALAFQALHAAGVIAVTGGGPDDYDKKKQLMESGWQEYSIKIGDTYFSYKYTPLMFVLGFLGNMNDAEQYGSDDDDTFIKRLELGLARFDNMIIEGTWINSASTFLG
ncbi:MAG TPA: hypothetical protein VFM18_08925, partial [Methanosarcina sp.]|nr:hypothetical protein [Methanosarcina sp.]